MVKALQSVVAEIARCIADRLVITPRWIVPIARYIGVFWINFTICFIESIRVLVSVVILIANVCRISKMSELISH